MEIMQSRKGGVGGGVIRGYRRSYLRCEVNDKTCEDVDECSLQSPLGRWYDG